MKRGAKLMVLFLTLILLGGGAFLAIRLNQENETAPESTDKSVTVCTLDTSGITQLAWTTGGESHTLTRDGSKWSYEEDPSLPLNGTVVDTMLAAVDEIVATRTIEVPEDLSLFGLTEPTLTINVTAAGDPVQFMVGGSNIDGQRYLALKGDSNVYLVDPAIGSAFELDRYDMIKWESVPDMSQVEQMSVRTQKSAYDVVYREKSGRTYSDSYVWFMESDDGYRALDNERLQEFFGTVSAVRWKECVNYNADPAALAEYGLDKPEVTYTIHFVQTSSGKEIRSSMTLELGGTTEDSAYARIAGSNMVYLVDSALREALLQTTADDLRPDDMLLVDWNAVTAVDFTVDGKTYHTEKTTTTTTDSTGAAVESSVWLMNGKETAIRIVMPETFNTQSTGYADASAVRGELMVGFVIHRDVKGYEQMEVNVYPYDSNNCLVTQNGKNHILIGKAEAEAIVAIAQALVTANQKA